MEDPNRYKCIWRYAKFFLALTFLDMPETFVIGNRDSG